MNDQRPQPEHSEPTIVQELIDEHIRVDCNLVQIDAQTWAIHGSIAVDGEVILAEFDSMEDAEAALERIASAEIRAVDSARQALTS